MLAELEAGCDALEAALVGVDPAVMTGADAADWAERLGRTIKRCTAVAAALGARAAECHSHRQRGYSTAAAWLAGSSGTSHADARRALQTARRLADTPGAAEATEAALATGEISMAEAAEIVDAERAAPGSEEPMLALARDPKAGLHALRDEGRRRRLEAMDPDQRHDTQTKERHVRMWTDELGMGRGQWALPPEVAAAVESRIATEADRIYRNARRQANIDGTEPPSWAACAADALAKLIRGEATGSGRGYTELVLVCDIAAFQRGYAEPGEIAQVLGGGPVPVEVIREAAVGAFIKGVLHDGKQILTIKHWGRYRPAELQTALDLGAPPLFLGAMCADCGGRWGLQWDHVDPVAHHGPTQYTNLAPRCLPCHLEKTERDRAAGLLGPNPPPLPTRQPGTRRTPNDSDMHADGHAEADASGDAEAADSQRMTYPSAADPEAADRQRLDCPGAVDPQLLNAPAAADLVPPIGTIPVSTAARGSDSPIENAGDCSSPEGPGSADIANTATDSPAKSAQSRARPPTRRPVPRPPTQPRSPRRPNPATQAAGRPGDLP